jgi:predicted DNA-binding transcriptional regulator AlpA
MSGSTPNQLPTSSLLLNIDQVAKALGICVRSAWSHVASGAIPSIRISPRCTRFSQADVEQFIDAKRHTAGRRAK